MSRRITYANVASTLALVVALGGTGAYAAGLAKDSVTSKQIKNGAVKAVDLDKGSVTSKAVAKNALTGADIDEKTLKTVPSATSVDSVRHLTASPTAGQTVPLLTKDSLTLSAVCSAGGAPSLELKTAVDHARWVTNNNRDQDFTVSDGPALFGAAADSVTGINLSVVSPTGTRMYIAGHVQATGPQCWLDIVLVG